MVVLGIWASLIAYAVIYAGLCNWQKPGSMPIAAAFTGKGGNCSCTGGGGQGGAGPSSGAPDAGPMPPVTSDIPVWSTPA